MGVFKNIKNYLRKDKILSSVQLVNETGNFFTAWNGKVYENDIVRGALSARAKRICKIELKHCFKPDGQLERVDMSANYRFMLQEPNPYMSIVDFLEKMSNLSALNGNAFALILRDENGVPRQLYPIPAVNAEAKYNDDGSLYLLFTLKNSERYQFAYEDIIHIREDYNENDIFGTSKFPSLAPLMEIVNTTDQGIINAIKNSAVIRWLLKINTALRDEDIKKKAQTFADNYLKISGNGIGVAATDTKTDATQINPTDYVPNASQMDRTKSRILSLLNINEKIIQGTANEDEENSYYEAEIEPWISKLANEMTRKLFSRRQRGCGNYIVAGSFNLQVASFKTKLNLFQMVDRGALTPNEWREAMGLTPIEGGDVPLRRLDTQAVSNLEGENTGGEEE